MNFLVSCFTAALVLVPGWGGQTLGDYSSMVRWSGCRAQIVFVEDRPPVTSYYGQDWTGTKYVVLGTQVDRETPYYVTAMVLFHELGHCLQDQAGTLQTLYQEGGRKAVELDADRQAADLACRYGLDGKRLLQELMVWILETYDYQGDPNHGTLEERIIQGEKAEACNLVPPQS